MCSLFSNPKKPAAISIRVEGMACDSCVAQDFQEIDELATEGGSKAILDEARWHGEDLAEQFASLMGFHEHAFWTFVECPKYWQGALAFHHADRVPLSVCGKTRKIGVFLFLVGSVSL